MMRGKLLLSGCFEVAFKKSEKTVSGFWQMNTG
jgi:hypothetical protein